MGRHLTKQEFDEVKPFLIKTPTYRDMSVAVKIAQHVLYMETKGQMGVLEDFTHLLRR